MFRIGLFPHQLTIFSKTSTASIKNSFLEIHRSAETNQPTNQPQQNLREQRCGWGLGVGKCPFPGHLIVLFLGSQVKVGVPSYFIIIFIIYSFKCSTLTSCSPAAGFCCKAEEGAAEGVNEGGRGAQKKTICFAGGCPAAFCLAGQQGAL